MVMGFPTTKRSDDEMEGARDAPWQTQDTNRAATKWRVSMHR